MSEYYDKYMEAFTSIISTTLKNAAMGFPAKTHEQLAQEYNSLLTNYQNVYINM